MSRDTRRDISVVSHSSTLSEGLVRALRFAPTSEVETSTSEHDGEAHGMGTQPGLPATETPRETLLRTLSVRSVVSTSSSSAERMNKARARDLEETLNYRIIGMGSCGTVFEIPETRHALKKGKDVAAMWKDFLLTNQVYQAIADSRDLLQDAFPGRTIPKCPQCSDFMLPKSEYWEKNLTKFPDTHRELGAAFRFDRILPLPRQTREALIKLYFDDEEDIQEAARNDEDNKHCLVRIYLGENEQDEEFYNSLQNFPMYLNMIEEVGLDKTALAIEMAIALAIIHWQAQVDAMDSEFVLGSTAATLSNRRRPFLPGKGTKVLPRPQEIRTIDFTERSTHVWVLDFDKANSIELTESDVNEKLVPAFLGNDPYYPRPDIDGDLWEDFSKAYLEASMLVLQQRQEKDFTMTLPKLFLTRVAEMIKAHEGWDPEEHIMFGE
ncbi:hypothetical protein MMC19_007115 [Ptychographa xylographoides]|nr:hypothetical protein [Ptychographa xylographoides]